MLVMGLLLICGVFVIADTLSVVKKEGETVTTPVGDVQNESMQGELFNTGAIEGKNVTPDTGSLTQNGTPKRPARLLVQFNVKAFPDGANLSVYANQTHASLNATLLRDFTPEGLSGLYLVELSGNMTPSEGVQAYKNQTSVIYAEPDYEIRL